MPGSGLGHRQRGDGFGIFCMLEMNQPLQVISGLSELLLVEVPEDNPLYSNLQKIIEQTDRMGEITGKLMNVTRYETKSYLKGKIVDIDKAAD